MWHIWAGRMKLSHLGVGLWDWAERFCAAPPDMVVGCKGETRCVAGAMKPDSEATACSLCPGLTPLRWEERGQSILDFSDDSEMKQFTVAVRIILFEFPVLSPTCSYVCISLIQYIESWLYTGHNLQLMCGHPYVSIHISIHMSTVCVPSISMQFWNFLGCLSNKFVIINLFRNTFVS